MNHNGTIDWTTLNRELVIDLFSRLNTRDRASLSSTCKNWRDIGLSRFLWQSLDVRTCKFDAMAAKSLSSRCKHLSRLQFNDAKTPLPLTNLNARNLKELIGYRCKDVTDNTLSVIVSEHPCIETLQLGPELCNISSRSVDVIANCCSNLQKLKLSGVKDINEDDINALAKCCKNLMEIWFIDCHNINETALGNVTSLRFLSVAGTMNMCWVAVSKIWTKLPNLIGLDVSRTNVDRNCISLLISSASGLKVLCALECHLLPEATVFKNLIKGDKKLLIDPSDLDQWIPSLIGEMRKHKEEMHFRGWRSFSVEKNFGTIMDWLEYVFSQFFLWDYQINPMVDHDFWYNLVPEILFSLIRSPQEDVVEIALETLSIIVIGHDSSEEHVESIPSIRNVEIGFLIQLSRSHNEGLQLRAVKAIANLSKSSYFGETIINQGAISYLSNLSESKSRLVVQAAVKALYTLSLSCNHQSTCFIEAGSIKALADSLSIWVGDEYILRVAAGALANLASHKICAEQICLIGGVNAVLACAFDCHFPLVSEQALRVLAQLCRHEDSEHIFAGTRSLADVLENLVRLTCKVYNGIRINAVQVLHNICCYEGQLKAIEEAGVVKSFVTLAQLDNPPVLLEKVARFLWKFSAVKEYNIAIGERGGITALIDLTRSSVAKVRDYAVGALCHLAFLPCNALKIKDEKGVPALTELGKLTESKGAHFYSTLALACLYDESDATFWDKELASNFISDYIPTVCDQTIFSFAAASPTSPMLQKQAKSLYIEDAELCESSVWIIERLISLLRVSSSDIKACAAFALVQYTTPSNIYWRKNIEFLQEAGGTKILRALAASKISPNPVKVLSKIVLSCVEQNQVVLPSTSNVERREKRRKHNHAS